MVPNKTELVWIRNQVDLMGNGKADYLAEETLCVKPLNSANYCIPVSPLRGAVHKVRHAIFDQFLPPLPLSNFVTHLETPLKYVTHLEPPFPDF